MTTGPQILLHAADPGLAAAPARLQAAFAQRHVALPAELAISLASALAARQPGSDPFWGRMHAMMARSLDLSGAIGGQLLLKEAGPFAAIRVCEPILRKAAADLGQMPLVAPAGAAPSGTASALEARIVRFVDTALADPAVMGRPFWAAAAMDVLAEARTIQRGRMRHLAATPGPRRIADPALTALVFLTPPDFDPERMRAERRRKARQISLRRRAGIRPKEGGVSGIRPSQALEDISDALMSELVLPRAVFASRLLHEGILVRHRPPRRDPRRDLLAATLLEAGAEDGMGLILRAAWADYALRLRVALNRLGLAQSDLLLACAHGPAAHLPGQLERAIEGKLPPLQIDGKLRADLLMGTGLFPDFLAWDAERPDLAPDLPGAPDWPAVRRLLRRATGQLARKDAQSETRLIEEYGARFLLWAAPVRDLSAESWDEARSRFEQDLGAEGRAGAVLARLVWQDDPAGTAPVELLGQCDSREVGELRLPLPPADDAAPDPGQPRSMAEFIGRLVLWMLDATLETLNGKA